MGLFEVNEAAELVTEAADEDANIIFGAVINEDFNDELRITVIATGFENDRRVEDESHEEVSEEDEKKSETFDIPVFLRRKR